MYSVELTSREERGFAVVALGGELDLVDTEAVYSHLMAAALPRGSVIVDLTGLTFISCGGLGMLVRVQRVTRAIGGELVLVAPQGPARALLEVTGLIGAFSIYPTVHQALRGAAPALSPVGS